jgi:hypothetical protein
MPTIGAGSGMALLNHVVGKLVIWGVGDLGGW